MNNDSPLQPPSAAAGSPMPRRKFLQLSGAVGALSMVESGRGAEKLSSRKEKSQKLQGSVRSGKREFNRAYTGDYLNHVAFPMGGIGAGMICLEGTGAFSHVSLRQQPEVFNEPVIFAAVSFKARPGAARVLEGPVLQRKLFGRPGTGNGASGSAFGLPRFATARFETRFPFGVVTLEDPHMPVKVRLNGWSPFEPGDEDNSSLPVAGLEYELTNVSRDALSGVFSFNARNFMASGGNPQAVRPIPGGFILWGSAGKDQSAEESAFAVTTSEPEAKVNHTWFRGGWFDPLTIAWKDISTAAAYDRPPVTEGAPSPGGTVFVPFDLAPGATRKFIVRLAWFMGRTKLRIGKDPAGLGSSPEEKHKPWYAGRFSDINSVSSYWQKNYEELRLKSARFSDCFYKSKLPPEVIEAVAANLTILKSPTVMRQADGRLWAWEGCNDNSGCCHGSCTHVWNYAQAIPHLFPRLERTLRETEFGPSQNEAGHQAFRTSLPIRPVEHDFHAAADGQLGGIMKAFREWRIGGDTEWLRKLWPRISQSLDYCIETWDPARKGWLEEPHHNTYDIEFWGPDGMCSSFYLGALQAAVLMGRGLGQDVSAYSDLLQKGLLAVERELYNGDYFVQRIQWKGLKAKSPLETQSFHAGYSPEALVLLEKEGPKYQYGEGCLSDGVLGSWLALVCGVGQVIDPAKVRSHLMAVHHHNLRHDLSSHANPQRPSYACGSEGGLLLCTWPRGGELSLPFVYSNEVWTGIEYQVASHLIRMGRVDEGLEIVRVCRNRYDGEVRNPFNEYECGHWYARAMSSYALLYGLSGARYDAVEKTLYVAPAIKGDFQCFFSAAGSYGTVGVRDGKPFYDPVSGQLQIQKIDYKPWKRST